MKTLIWYAGLYSGSAALLKLSGFALFLWLARSLSVQSYATFGLLYAVQTGIVTFGLAGVIEGVVASLKSHRETEARKALYTTASVVFVGTASAASLLSVAGFLLFAQNTEITGSTLIWVLASGVTLAYVSFQAQVVRLEERHLSSLLYSFVAPMLGLGGGFVAFLFERTLSSFFLGSSLGVLVAAFILWGTRLGFRRAHGGTVGIRQLFLIAAPFVVVAVFAWLSGYGNNFVITMLFESVEVAKFTFALTLSSVMQLVATALNQVWSPRFYRITHDEPFADVERKNRFFFRAQAMVLGLLGGLLVAVFPLVIPMLGGNLVAYQSMTLEMALIVGSYVLLTPWWHCQNYYLAHGRGSELMRIVLGTSVLGIGIWIALMVVLGPIGVYLGFLVQMLVRGTGVLVVAKKRWPVTIPWSGVLVGALLVVLGYAVSGA